MGKNVVLKLYNGDFEPVRVIDNFTSLIWRESYGASDYGDFELCLNPDEYQDYAIVFQVNRFIVRGDTEEVMVITGYEITNDENSEQEVIIKGVQWKDMLARRVMRSVYQSRTLRHNYLKYIVNNNIGNTASAKRKLTSYDGNTNFLFDFQTATASTIYYYNTEDKYKNCRDLMTGYERAWGYRWSKKSYGQTYTDTIPIQQTLIPIQTKSNVVLRKATGDVLVATQKQDVTGFTTSMVGHSKAKLNAQDIQCEYNANDSTYTSFERFEGATEISQWNTSLTAAMVTSCQWIQPYIKAQIWSSDWNCFVFSMTGVHFQYPSEQLRDYVYDNLSDASDWTKDTYNGEYALYYSGTKYFGTNREASSDCTASELEYDWIQPVLLCRDIYNEAMWAYEWINPYEDSFTFDSDNSRYTFNTDFKLGDCVTYVSPWGSSKSVVVTESIETWDENGYDLELSFESRDNFGKYNV